MRIAVRPFGFLLCLAAWGCGDSPRMSPAGRTALVDESHDFGLIVAAGQALHHSFSLMNATDRPIRVLRAIASNPCCSAVGPVPESVPPGGWVGIPIRIDAGTHSGARRFEFRVLTDDPAEPVRRFSASVDLLSEVEIATQPPRPVVPVARGGTFDVLVTARSPPGRGESARLLLGRSRLFQF